MKQLKEKLAIWMERAKRYKYTMLILALGVGLICIPFPDGRQTDEETQLMPVQEQLTLEEEMQHILSQIEGAGDVRVLLSPEVGITHTYQENIQVNTQTDGTETNTQTVLVSSDSGEQPLEVKMTYPTYRGAVVVCQGADKAVVKLAIVRAVSSLTGLSSDHITVIKMKSN